mmetsp:Transcript_21511/g.55011  ORF Transcript_21511/g.55011 Transcript_21511/m.55011 type:complete len:242 (+) Transcript_21511:422-1147(+)
MARGDQPIPAWDVRCDRLHLLGDHQRIEPSAMRPSIQTPSRTWHRRARTLSSTCCSSSAACSVRTSIPQRTAARRLRQRRTRHRGRLRPPRLHRPSGRRCPATVVLRPVSRRLPRPALQHPRKPLRPGWPLRRKARVTRCPMRLPRCQHGRPRPCLAKSGALCQQHLRRGKERLLLGQLRRRPGAGRRGGGECHPNRAPRPPRRGPMGLSRVLGCRHRVSGRRVEAVRPLRGLLSGGSGSW